MPMQLIMGAMMTCPFMTAPASLVILPTNMVLANNMPAANIMDNKPIVNVPTFATCTSLANPTVASATSAAMGVLTPMPCVPNTSAPWTPGNPTVLLANMPIVNNTSVLTCMWGGVITISFAGQVTAMD